jgi:phosphate transport system protein
MTDIEATPQTEEHGEIRHRFEQQLEDIHEGLIRMASLVLENTKRAGEALLDNRLDLVEDVFAADQEVDALYAHLEEEVFGVLARQQPVAKDLRFLVSATRILYELERSGDLAVNCAKGLRRSDGFAMSNNLKATLARLIDDSTALFGEGINALADMDATAGSRLDEQDDRVDESCGDFYRELAQESDSMGLAGAIELSRIGRYLERIADHAVNMAETITYTVTGQYPHLIDPSFVESEV